MGMGADCTPSDYERQGRGRRGRGLRCSEGWLGAGTAWIAGRPLARAGVHRVLGQVSSFCPDVSRFRPNVSTFRGRSPQMCPPGTAPGMCQPGLDKGKGRGERGRVVR